MTDEAAGAATPPGRDRYVDLLRVVSLAVVVLGHWSMAVVAVADDGTVRAANLLAAAPRWHALTWLFQVMPVFFLVGGFAHAAALRSPRHRGYAAFIRSRGARLLRPTGVFVAVWLAAAAAIEWAGADAGALRLAARTAAQPLWFVGVYLAVIGLAPALHRLHRWCGRRAWMVPAALAAGAAAVDALRFGAGLSQVGHLNLLLVWLTLHQLGFFGYDGVRDQVRRGLALAAAGLAAVLALTRFGPYPTSMVGLPGAGVSNMSPPTLALLAHGLWLCGLVLVLRWPLTRWLARARPWRAVVAANSVAMTVYLWHLTALFLAAAALVGAGVGTPAAGSAGWWATRPAWLLGPALLTAGLAWLFRRADRPRRTPDGGPGGTAAWGVVLAAIGVLGLSATGFAGPAAGRTATLVVLPLTPLWAAGLAAAGALLLGAVTGSQRLPRTGSHRLSLSE